MELNNPYNSGIMPGITVVIGENGSGKTTLGIILEKGRYAYGNRLSFNPENLRVKMLSFSDIHSLSGMEVTYYHQRMEATMNDYVPTVDEIMLRRNAPPEWRKRCEAVGLKDIGAKKVNFLSSGELRKLLIVNALLDDPDLLILDNPYIGLDPESRKEFDISIKKLREKGVSVVMLLCDSSDIPDFTDMVMKIEAGTIYPPAPFLKMQEGYLARQDAEENSSSLHIDIPFKHNEYPPHKIAFEIRNGEINYDGKKIFNGVNWQVKSGECWSLSGRNGSGKSLLLSMICADNPQAYSNEITIFDRKRGSGESIFEIKDNIGYVSPEMQLYFNSGDTVKEIVVQGKRNSLNRYKRSSETELEEALHWLSILGIAKVADRKFTQLSNGEQRLVLLAAAFIKQPPLLVLDEPFHGLDEKSKKRVSEIINALAERNKSALIFVTHYEEEVPQCVQKSFHLG